MVLNIPSPLQQLHSPLLDKKKIQLWVKRDDLTHPQVQGNKWRKLKYNLTAFQQSQKKYLLTFGGAFSNHIYATAAAGQLFGFPTIGIIRGEEVLPLNPMLSFAKRKKMELHYVDRTTYRLKEKMLASLNLPLDDYYILPEGGTNQLALQGCAELGEEILEQMETPPDFIGVSCGTGGTMAGLVRGVNSSTHVLGFSALKGNFMEKEIQSLLGIYFPQKKFMNYSVNTDYHFGGYAKMKPELLKFMSDFEKEFGFTLERIYTGKLFYGIFDLIKQGFFPKESKIVIVHSGGIFENLK